MDGTANIYAIEPSRRRAGSMMGKTLRVFPDSVSGHVEAARNGLAPIGCGDRFAPVVRHFDGVTVAQFGDADVAVEASVAIVTGPFDDDDVVVEVESAADSQGQFRKAAFDLADEIAAVYDLR
jgi:hypothetical protein